MFSFSQFSFKTKGIGTSGQRSSLYVSVLVATISDIWDFPFRNRPYSKIFSKYKKNHNMVAQGKHLTHKTEANKINMEEKRLQRLQE